MTSQKAQLNVTGTPPSADWSDLDFADFPATEQISAVVALTAPTEPISEHVVLILSGGLDSTVLGYRLRASGTRLTMLSFDYGQRHRCELEYARRTAMKLASVHHVIDLSTISSLLAGSSLTDAAVDVPEGHYTDQSMRITVVPNRNAIMLDVAVAQAVVVQAGVVAFGAHAGDHPIYPDCRPAFLDAYQRMVLLANEGFLAPQFRVLPHLWGCPRQKL